MGWRLAERVEQEKLLPGDHIEVAFTIGHNDHPEFGGIELSVRDFRIQKENLHFSQNRGEMGQPQDAKAHEAARN
jgi:hypothetical protein